MECLQKILAAVFVHHTQARLERRMLGDLLAGLFPTDTDSEKLKILTISCDKSSSILLPIRHKQSAAERRHPNQPSYARFYKDRRRF